VSFARYPAYRESAVEWIGKVPSHWEVLPLARITRERCDGPFGSGLKSEHYVQSGVRVIRLQNIRADAFDGTDEAFIDEDYFRKELARHEVRAGDVLIAGLGDERNLVGRACVAPADIEPAMVKADCFRFRIFLERALPAFVAAQLSAGAEFDAAVLSSGSTRSRISLSTMGTRQLALPTVEEQRAIVDFLHDETTKLDALVAEQHRLIALLREKRQAVVTQALSQGIDPHLTARPAEVEGLGTLPTHWRGVRVKHILRSVEQGWSPQCEAFPVQSTAEWGVLKVGCVNGGVFEPAQNKRLPDDLTPLPELALQAGDVLVSRANTRDLVGSAAVVPTDHPNLLLCDKLYRLRVAPALCAPEFLARWLGTPFARGWIEMAASGASASMVNVSQSTILELPIAIPPLAEQFAIEAHVRERSAALDALTDEAARAVALLQERRSALISAAVTGQIDVRAYRPAEELVPA
jgi:type I restriction enzyme S subunit